MRKTLKNKRLVKVSNDENVCAFNIEDRMLRKEHKRKEQRCDNIDEKRVNSYFNVKSDNFNLHIDLSKIQIKMRTIIEISPVSELLNIIKHFDLDSDSLKFFLTYLNHKLKVEALSVNNKEVLMFLPDKLISIKTDDCSLIYLITSTLINIFYLDDEFLIKFSEKIENIQHIMNLIEIYPFDWDLLTNTLYIALMIYDDEDNMKKLPTLIDISLNYKKTKSNNELDSILNLIIELYVEREENLDTNKSLLIIDFMIRELHGIKENSILGSKPYKILFTLTEKLKSISTDKLKFSNNLIQLISMFNNNDGFVEVSLKLYEIIILTGVKINWNKMIENISGYLGYLIVNKDKIIRISTFHIIVSLTNRIIKTNLETFIFLCDDKFKFFSNLFILEEIFSENLLLKDEILTLINTSLNTYGNYAFKYFKNTCLTWLKKQLFKNDLPLQQRTLNEVLNFLNYDQSNYYNESFDLHTIKETIELMILRSKNEVILINANNVMNFISDKYYFQ